MRLREKPEIQMRFDRIEISLNLDRNNPDEVINLFGKLKTDTEYDITARERARRSLNANSYHWMLCNKLADALGVSNWEVHNQLLVDYGIDWLDDGMQQTYILMKDDDRYRRSETVHYRPTDHVENRNGTYYRWFVLLKPSHLMDKKEMARLINGTVEECHAVGIDTRTPEELETMLDRWGEKRA